MTKINIPPNIPLELIKKLFNLLSEAGESRLVGGCVRDIICGRISDDVDIATTALPEQVLKIFSEHNIKAIPTGIKHGTITGIFDQHILEITTLRKDVECFGRHAVVEFTDNWQEDASRRDFTINAMSMDLEGNIYDYFGGIDDLKNSLIRFVGVAEKRIQEDYLRILRYFRFYSYFGGNNIDRQSLTAVSKYAPQMATLSGERIRREMFKIIKNKYAYDTIKFMVGNGIWEHLNCEHPNLAKLCGYKFCSEALINLAAIIRSTSDPILNCRNIRLRWRLSNKEMTTLEMLCSKDYELNSNNDINAKKALYFLGKQSFLMQLKLKFVEEPNKDLSKLFELAENFITPVFPLSGKDVRKIGFEGKEIGKIILYATNAWINSNFSLKKEELLELVKTYYISRA
ncbi:CCA tRNA nucleotidyltransferase [Holosporaceae bacterium 'Namur']|nr:CCA tRNA nucleotidyltransferase [Holosporaceae bacterium 'Namur']